MEDYRYMVWNDLKKEYQFSNICETTEKGANTLLFKTIGNDARKWRFIIVKLVPIKIKVSRIKIINLIFLGLKYRQHELQLQTY